MPDAEVSHEARFVVAFVRRLRRGDGVILRLRGEADRPLWGHCTEDGLLNVITDPERRLALRLRRVFRGPDLRLRMDVPLETIEGRPHPPHTRPPSLAVWGAPVAAAPWATGRLLLFGGIGADTGCAGVCFCFLARTPSTDWCSVVPPPLIPAPVPLSCAAVEAHVVRLGMQPPTHMGAALALATRLLWVDERRGGGRVGGGRGGGGQ
jgi:hypothetical protein